MKDVVEKILREEERASKIFQSAKEEADRIVKEAKKEKEDIISRAISQAEDSGHKEKQDSEKRFMSEKEKALRDVKTETLAIREKNDKDISEISKKVFSRIMTIE